MTKKFWVTGVVANPELEGGPRSGSVDLDAPGAQLVYDRQNLRHMFGSANSTEVTAPDWTVFAGIAVALGVPHVIRVEKQMFTPAEVRPDAYAVAGGHVYLGFAELEDYGVAADLLLRAREETNQVMATNRQFNVRTDAVMRYGDVRQIGGPRYVMEADYYSVTDDQIWQRMLVTAVGDGPVEIQCVSGCDAPCITITNAAILADASPDFDLCVHSMNKEHESVVMTLGLFREIEREMHSRIRQYNAEEQG